MKQETTAALALSLTPGLGLQKLLRLVRRLDSPQEVERLDRRRMQALRLPPEARASLLSGRSRKLAEDAARQAEDLGVRILSPWEDGYPPRLLEIYDPPLILYALGRIDLLSRPGVALVGSRRASVYGRQVGLRLARELALTGLTVVSGMARGIDAIAHRGALEVGGATVAVLGSGVNVPYPRENRPLYDQIAAQGCIISEFPCGCFPAPQNFPIRNRIISGLGLGTIIGEAAEFSGSLITARLTLEQNRELWAVPGNVTSKGSYGPNYLIKQGASVVMEAQDVLDDLPLYVLEDLRASSPDCSAQDSETSPEQATEALSPIERRLLNRLPVDQGVHIDQLLEEESCSPAEVNQALLELQLKGRVLQLPGQLYSRKLS